MNELKFVDAPKGLLKGKYTPLYKELKKQPRGKALELSIDNVNLYIIKNGFYQWARNCGLKGRTKLDLKAGKLWLWLEEVRE